MAKHHMEPTGTQYRCQYCRRVGFYSLRHIECPVSAHARIDRVERILNGDKLVPWAA